MALRHHAIRRRVALVTAASVLLSPCTTLLAAAPKPAAVTRTPQPIDGGWPKSYVTPNGARVILYEPQIASWEDQKRLTLYAAVSFTSAGAAKPVLGTVTAVADTKVAVSERLVDFSVFRIIDSNFPTLDKDQMQALLSELEKAIPQQERVIALDRVLMEPWERQASQRRRAATCTPATTATSIAIRAAAGRSTTAVVGTARRSRRRQPSVSSIAIRPHAPRGCSDRGTSAASAPAAGSAAAAFVRAAEDLAAVDSEGAAASAAAAGSRWLRRARRSACSDGAGS